MLLLLKIIVVPALIVSVTLAGRRWGPRIGGVLASLPVVAGPVLFFFAIEQGDRFAAEAARATLVSLGAVVTFSVTYAWACLRTSWWTSLAISWLSFATVLFLLHRWHWITLAAFGAASLSLILGQAVLPVARGRVAPARPPAWDIPVRVLSAVVLVLTITALARRLGPAWSGALTPFPIALAILLAFTHAQQGPATTIRFLRGFFPGMWSFVVFLLVTALVLAHLGKWLGFLAALMPVVLIQVTVLWWTGRRRAPRRY